MDVNEIKKLIEIIDQSDIAELVVKRDGEELVIKKPTAFNPAPSAQPVHAHHGAHVPVAPQPVAAPTLEPEKEADELPDNHTTVVAPMVGTFYRAPAPDAKPYVEIGDKVQVGQPLCIIEAMKLMNEIESEVSGKVVKILVDNAQPVEYGQPLFIVAKS